MDPLNILLVDDSKSARYALRLQLQRYGVQVDTADSAETALERIGTTPPDAVLMDHTMPCMNGFEALEILKSDLATAHIPVVMCTSHDDPSFAAQAVKRGAMSVLSKAGAGERLPEVLDQIRAALAAQIEVAGAPPVQEQVAEAAAATTPPPIPVPSRAEIETWIEAWLDAHLGQRLAEAMEPHLARLTTQLRQVIVEQVEMAVDALAPPAPASVIEPAPVPHPAPVPAAPPVDLDHLREQIIPAAVHRHFDSERDGMIRMMQQCVHETHARHAADPALLRSITQSVDETVTSQATEIARREAQEAVQTALAGDREAVAALQRALRLSYGLGAAALLIGIGATAAVFLF